MGRNSFQCPLRKMHSRSEFVTFTKQLQKNRHGDPPVLFHVLKENAILHNISNFEDFFIVDVQIFFSNNCCNAMLGVLPKGVVMVGRWAYYFTTLMFLKMFQQFTTTLLWDHRSRTLFSNSLATFQKQWVLYNLGQDFQFRYHKLTELFFIIAPKLKNQHGDPNFLFYILDQLSVVNNCAKLKRNAITPSFFKEITVRL